MVQELFTERESLSTHDMPRGLRGGMSVIEVMFTVISYNGPAVVFMGFIPVAILLGNGLGTPALILAVGLVVLVIASGLMKMSSTLKRSGGFYSFIAAGLGKEAGLAGGFGAVITYLAALISVYGLSGIALSDILVVLFDGPELPWPLGGLIVLLAVTVLGHFNINFSAKALLVALSLEILLVGAYVISVLVQGGAAGIGFESFSTQSFFAGSLGIGALFAVGLFGGSEATVIFRDEVRDPDRTIPRATYGVVISIAVMYAILSWALINAYGADVVMSILADDVVDASGASVREYVGDFAYAVAIVLLFTSAFALALSAHNILTRYIFNLATDGVLPRKLGVAHQRHVSPSRASFVVSIVALMILIVLILAQVPRDGLYGYVAGIYSYGMLIMLTLVSLAISVFLFKRVPGRKIHGLAMMIAFLILISVLVFASFNFEVLSGMTGVVGVSVLAAIWLFIFSGVFIAARFKKTKPEVYFKIGRE